MNRELRQSIKNGIIVYLLWNTLIYSCFSFWAWSFNPFYWGEYPRGFFIMLSPICGLCVIGMVASIFKNQ